MSHSFIIVIIIIITRSSLSSMICRCMSSTPCQQSSSFSELWASELSCQSILNTTSGNQHPVRVKNFLKSLSYSFAHLLHIFRYLRGRNASRPNLVFSFLKCEYSKLKIYAKKLLLTNWQPFKSLIRSFQKLVPPFHSQLYRLAPPPKRIIRSCQEIPVVWQKPFLQWSAFFSLALSFQSKWRGGNRLIRNRLLTLQLTSNEKNSTGNISIKGSDFELESWRVTLWWWESPPPSPSFLPPLLRAQHLRWSV